MGVPGSAGASDCPGQGNPGAMRTAVTLQIAFRNFTRNSRRFLLLGPCRHGGFFFVCTVQSLVAGLSYQISIGAPGTTAAR